MQNPQPLTLNKSNLGSSISATREELIYFIESMSYTKLQAGQAKKALSKTIQYHSRYLPFDALIRELVIENRTLCMREENKIKPMSSRAYFRANNQEQEDHERKIRDAGKKWVYSLETDELSMDIGAFGYAYAKYLLTQKISES